MLNKKPVVFVSSTIFDFRDLRSAIKYYFEELDYEVLLSEYNDFPKPLDKNTIEACLATLERADYYILLIGSRVGGYYDAQNQISITRAEYRRAYELVKNGTLRLIIFVRNDLWTIKADRKALVEYLEAEYHSQKEIRNEAGKIGNHPSSYLNDAETIFSFIEEVARANEMQAAVDGLASFPSANWVHPFMTFRDMVDVFKANLGISESLSTVALRTNLKRELLQNLILLMEKHKGQLSPSYKWAAFARRQITGGFKDSSELPGRYLQWVVVFSLFCARPGHWLSTQFLDQVLESGLFLQYDNDGAVFKSTLMSERLFQLKDGIEKLRGMGSEIQQLLVKFIAKYSELAKTDGNVVVPNEDLFVPLSFSDRQEDVVILTVAIIEALGGNTSRLQSLKLNPPSPFVPEAEQIEKETVTLDDLGIWIAGSPQL